MKPKDPTKLFGTDGLRGEAGKFPLDPSTIRNIGSSLAGQLAQRTDDSPSIVIGRDTRESGPWIQRELILGARTAGAEIQSAGIIPTPGVAFLARTLGVSAGIVISASHNAYEDNGIKVFDPSGRKLDDATERLIERDIAASRTGSGQESESLNEHAGGPVLEDEVAADELRQRYLDYLLEDIARDLSLADTRIVVDCANGAAYELAPELFQRLGSRIFAINTEPDGRNINRDCGSLHMEGLRQRTVAEHADIGVALDGDADRALFVDATGNLVDGDATMWIMANYLKSRGDLATDTVVGTVMSNLGLEVALRSRGIKLVRTDVGDKYVLEELIRSGAVIGGEQSGHIIFPRLSLAGDGMMTSLFLLRVMRDEKKSLAELTAGFQRYPQVLVNVRVREKPSFDSLPSVSRLAKQVEEKLGDRGRLLLRYSGTEPLARVMIEGESEGEVKVHAAALADAIRAELGAEGA